MTGGFPRKKNLRLLRSGEESDLQIGLMLTNLIMYNQKATGHQVAIPTVKTPVGGLVCTTATPSAALPAKKISTICVTAMVIA